MSGCAPTDFNCLLAAGRAGTNIYDASAGSLPGAIPGTSAPANDFIGSALKSVGLGGVDSFLHDHVDNPLTGALSDTYHVVADPVAAIGAGLKFLADPPRVAVTAIGFLLIGAGLFMLGKTQILQLVK